MNVFSHFSTFLLAAILTAGLAFATGCDSTGVDDPLDEEAGTVETRLSGADDGTAQTNAFRTNSHVATDLQEALVTIDEVVLVPVEDTSADESEEVGLTLLTEESFEVDLIDLEAGLDTTLSELEVPAGEYGQLRLIVENEVQVTFADDTEASVMIASGQQTGLKLNFDPFVIGPADDQVEITAEWNVEDSIEGSPQGQLVITPAIDATVDTTQASN